MAASIMPLKSVFDDFKQTINIQRLAEEIDRSIRQRLDTAALVIIGSNEDDRAMFVVSDQLGLKFQAAFAWKMNVEDETVCRVRNVRFEERFAGVEQVDAIPGGLA